MDFPDNRLRRLDKCACNSETGQTNIHTVIFTNDFSSLFLHSHLKLPTTTHLAPGHGIGKAGKWPSLQVTSKLHPFNSHSQQ